MVKRTFQPHKKRRKRKHGFLNKNKKVLAKRRRKGRKRLSA